MVQQQQIDLLTAIMRIFFKQVVVVEIKKNDVVVLYLIAYVRMKTNKETEVAVTM